MENLVVIGLSIIAVIFAYLQWKHPKAPKPPTIIEKPDSILENILKTKVLRVGFFHYPPLIDYRELDNNITVNGVYAEVLVEFAKVNSLEIEWIPLKLSEAIPAVINNDIDCYACIMLSDTRYRECDFVGLLHSIAVIGIVKRTEQSVKHPSDLTNRNDIRIAVCQGEIGHHTALGTLRIPSRRLVEVNSGDISEIIAQVRSGNVNVALADALSCKRMMNTSNAKKEFKLVFADPPILTVPNGFMIRKNNTELNTWLDTGLRKACTSLEYKKIDESLKSEFGNFISSLC